MNLSMLAFTLIVYAVWSMWWLLYMVCDRRRYSMKHDGRCEYGSVSMYSNSHRITCYCAQRAYANDPLPDAPLPHDVKTSDYQSGIADDWDYPT